MNKLAQEKLEKNGNLISKYTEKKKENNGMLVNMVLSSGAGVGAKSTSLYADVAPKRERLKSIEIEATVETTPVQIIPPLSTTKELMQRVRLLSNSEYNIHDSVDILLNGTIPLNHSNNNDTVLAQLSEDQIEDIQVADSAGNMYANVMTQNRINLHDLRNVWAYNSTQDSRGNRSIIQKRYVYLYNMYYHSCLFMYMCVIDYSLIHMKNLKYYH